ncbi:MAG: hypothetical protein RIK87_09755 [Fuerstiella sp.]
MKDADGHWRFTLNGDVIFHWGPLDQGWWPDGLLTPPSDQAMLFDIEWLSLITYDRKAIKIPAEEVAELHRILFTAPPRPAESGSRNK